MKKMCIFFIFFVGSFTICTKAQSDSLYHVELSITPTPIVSLFKDERYSGGPNNPFLGYGMNIRAMWHPGRLIAFGIMTGYLFIVKDEFVINSVSDNNINQKASAKLNAVPLQVAVSMQKSGLEIGVGMGPYILLSTIEYGKTANSRRFELGLTFWGSYTFSIGKNIFVAPELRILSFNYRGILSVMPSITTRINVWSY